SYARLRLNNLTMPGEVVNAQRREERTMRFKFLYLERHCGTTDHVARHMRKAYAMKMWALVVSMFALQVAATAAAAAVAPPIAAWAPCPWGSAGCNVCGADAVDSLNRLREHGDAMGFQMNGAPDVIFDKHWQGVQRLMGGAGRHLAISRSLQDENINVSFVIVEMASRNGAGLRFRSNRLDPDFPIANT